LQYCLQIYMAKYKISSLGMNQLVLSFGRTRNFKMLTLTMGFHRSSQH
jgi:hypothetical protein